MVVYVYFYVHIFIDVAGDRGWGLCCWCLVRRWSPVSSKSPLVHRKCPFKLPFLYFICDVRGDEWGRSPMSPQADLKCKRERQTSIS